MARDAASRGCRPGRRDLRRSWSHGRHSGELRGRAGARSGGSGANDRRHRTGRGRSARLARLPRVRRRVRARVRVYGPGGAGADVTPTIDAANESAAGVGRDCGRTNRDLSDGNTRRMAPDRSNRGPAIRRVTRGTGSVQARRPGTVLRRSRCRVRTHRNMVTPALTVVRPGMLTTVQDLGRWGYQAVGVPVAGPMDWYSHRLANLRVGNPPMAAALEITLIGPELVAEGNITCAVAGADFAVRVNDSAVDSTRTFDLVHGDRLRFGARRSGARATLAVAGGIDVPSVLGSR